MSSVASPRRVNRLRLSGPRLVGYRSRRSQAGFTLLEMLLVVAVVVAVAAMAAPAFRTVLDTRRLTDGGGHVRAQLAKAKNRAMRQGRIYVFRYQPTADAFYFQPWYSDEDFLQASPGTDFVDPFSVPDHLERLPEGVIFLGGDNLAEARDLGVEQDILQQGGAGGEWSRPILFYPDGSSSTAKIILQNRRMETLVVSLRGLTGIASLGDVDSSNRANP